MESGVKQNCTKECLLLDIVFKIPTSEHYGAGQIVS
jgi:hypothetical protein